VAGTTARSRALAAADDLLARADSCGAVVLHSGHADYPPRLAELHDPPPCLYCLGTLGVLRAPAVAIVGTRRATPYGERVTREVAGTLARAGMVIVSGMARGIDAAAHRAALEVGGTTIAVLGTGVDVAYPTAHRQLHSEIARRGLLISEEQPGGRATPASFPKRNRIIAALASATIIVEAPVKSGALITAGHALDLGRSVAAVPGPIYSLQSAGTNELIRDGAIVIACVADALAMVGVTAPATSDPELRTPAERRIWEALSAGPTDVDNLAALTTLPARECLAAVTTLELRGAVVCELTGEVRRG
jgi:DNA protecting protein DprA